MSEHKDSGHGPDDHNVHVYEGPGIEEGNAPVPKWYLAVVAVLVVFGVVYLTSNLTGWNPWASQWK
jgi:hypothetical protein